MTHYNKLRLGVCPMRLLIKKYIGPTIMVSAEICSGYEALDSHYEYRLENMPISKSEVKHNDNGVTNC